MHSQLATRNTDTAIFARLIQAREEDLSAEAARYLMSFRFDENDVARVNELSEMASLGTLSPEDEAELDSYIHVGNLLAIMQSNARRALVESGTSPT